MISPPLQRRILTLLAALLTISSTSALATPTGDLVISEFCADPDDSFLDEDGDASDWIELRNTSNNTIAIGGHFLTDNQSIPTQWQLPSISLDAGEFLLIFASGKNRATPGSQLHTNFSLNNNGEYLALIAPDGSTAVCEFTPSYPRQFYGQSYGNSITSASNSTPQTYLQTPAAATWFVPTSDIGHTWQLPGFDDSSWTSATTGIGFGFGYENYIGSNGNVQSAMTAINEGIYIRLPFLVPDPSLLQSLTLSLLFEDGVVAYLNGTLVASENAPSPLSFNSPATVNSEVSAATLPSIFNLNFAGKLVPGENILAIHLLNRTRTSSDILVVPQLSGYTTNGSTTLGYMANPTPSSTNSPIDWTDFVRDTNFNIDRGFFNTPTNVTLSSPTPGATLVYTTDGNSPTLTNGTVITPTNQLTPPQTTLNLNTTTIVRAAAFKNGYRPTNIDTQSYFFLDSVLDQPENPPGYPLPWITRSGAAIEGDYGMDPDIVGTVYSRDELKDSLTSIPTISIVTDIANLFDQQTGIQVNPLDSGENSERPISVELLGFESAPNSQADAGMRMNGNASRSTSRPKHNFRVTYRNQYGTGRLQYPLFGTDAPASRFNAYILRGGNGNSWIHPTPSVYNGAMYIRDQWFRDAHTAMGYPEALQREVHVYFNGLYWGMHHLFERIDEEWAAERFGGSEDDWEGFRIVGGNNIEILNGTPAEQSARMLNSWAAVVAAANAGNLAAVEQYLDLDAFIDYLLLNFHAGNNDWDGNNVRAMRRISPPGKYMWFCHDAERAGFNVPGTITVNVTNKNTPNAPTGINTALRNHPEYAIRFADRAQKHLFNNGALTPENGIAQWSARADGIRDAMKAESARWGDYRGNPPRTLVQWEAALQREYNDWFPHRTPVTISQLRATGLYPLTDPPTFNQHGGQVPPSFNLIISNNSGDIYYTTDGSDPRLPGGNINPNAVQIADGIINVESIPVDTIWKYNDTGTDLATSWREPSFDDSTWPSGPAPLGYGDIQNTTIATTVNTARHLTAYFRSTFQLNNSNQATAGTLRVSSDGGAVVYLNGIEIARDNMPAGPINFNTPSNGEGTEGVFDSFSIDQTQLVNGTNTIAIEVHNSSTASSDMVIAATLTLSLTNTSNSPIPINNTTTIRARSLDNGDWSALNEATFLTGSPANSDNLVISEIHYNPSPTQGELAEFIELMNISNTHVDLAGTAFTQGIDFIFPDTLTLPPGARILLIADPATFEATHGTNTPVVGTYSGRLANNGETLTLIASNGTTIQSFNFNDQSPWPEEADGDGYSLTLIAPLTSPDHSLPQNWRASLTQSGSPGTTDSLPFTQDLLTYALGDSHSLNIRSVNQLQALEFPRALGSDDADVTIELSTDLETWTAAPLTLLSQSPRQGTLTFTRWLLPNPTTERRFARLVVTLRQ